MLNETELKEKLQALAQNEFHPLEKENLSELIPAMLNHIGSTDSYLRDELIYSAFGTWILRYSALRPEQLRSLLPILLMEMVYRSLYFFSQAHHRGQADDVVTYLATNTKLLGILERKRKDAHPSPLELIPILTDAHLP